MNILMIDDIREPRDEHSCTVNDSVIVARTFSAGKSLLLYGAIEIDVLLLDHDLGGTTSETGYDIIFALEKCLNEDYNLFKSRIPKKMICVSANSVGRKRIDACWKAILDLQSNEDKT